MNPTKYTYSPYFPPKFCCGPQIEKRDRPCPERKQIDPLGGPRCDGCHEATRVDLKKRYPELFPKTKN